jgi:hypothetical protein
MAEKGGEEGAGTDAMIISAYSAAEQALYECDMS